MIYFLTYETLPGYVKIGYSKNEESLKRRLNAYVTYNPSPLKILKIENGDEAKEQQLHDRFSRYRAQNEWFYYTEELKEYVEKGEVVETDPDNIKKHLHQRKEGHMIYFLRKIPKELRRFANGKTYWKSKLGYDYELALVRLREETKLTDDWIDKHTNLLRRTLLRVA